METLRHFQARSCALGANGGSGLARRSVLGAHAQRSVRAWPGVPHTRKLSTPSAVNMQTTGTEVEAPTQQGSDWPGISAWLTVSTPAKVKTTLHDLRRGFLKHWKEQRAAHWQQQQSAATGSTGFHKQGGASSAPNGTSDASTDGTATNSSTNDATAKSGGSANGSAQTTMLAPDYLEGDVGKVVRDLTKYGEMVQAVYDTLLTKDVDSSLFGSCTPGTMVPGKLLGERPPGMPEYITIGAEAGQYRVVTRIQADAGAYKLVAKPGGRNYVGIIAQGPGAEEKAPVDIAIVFRGTITQDEWVQDAKALQARWNCGQQVVAPPNILLTSSPFQGDIRVFLWTFIATLLLLNSDFGSSVVQALQGVVAGITALINSAGSSGGVAAAVWHSLTAIFSPFAGAYYAAVGFVAWFFSTLHVIRPEVPFLSSSAVTATTAFVIWGIFAALFPDPEKWAANVTQLIKAILPWAVFGTWTLLDGLLGPGRDARVSYGFKEMYCDAREGRSHHSKPGSQKVDTSSVEVIKPHVMAKLKKGPKDTNGANDVDRVKDVDAGKNTEPKAVVEGIQSNGHTDGAESALTLTKDDPLLPPSPRLTVYETLVELMEKGVDIRSITITGHSLGGALASMCGFDLSTAIGEARTEGKSAEALGKPDMTPGSLYDVTDKKRSRFIELLMQKKLQKVPVGVITFAAPRVGDANYTTAYAGRSLMCPMGVVEPFWSNTYVRGLWGHLSAAVRSIAQVSKMPWYLVGMLQVLMKGNKPKAGSEHVGMLRVVNADDVVPTTPFTLPFPPFMYVHGGHELLLNSYFIYYFKASITGATLGARHNLEMYLHMLNPARDKALVNKSEDLLDKDCKIPACWWNPVPNKGMQRDDHGNWVKPN